MDFSTNYRFGGGFAVGLSVSNLLDDEHLEVFGGDLLGRHAVAHVTFDW